MKYIYILYAKVYHGLTTKQLQLDLIKLATLNKQNVNYCLCMVRENILRNFVGLELCPKYYYGRGTLGQGCLERVTT